MQAYISTPDYYRDYIAHDFYISTPDFYNDYIAHYGVKGMRWGQRKQYVKIGRRGRRFNTGTYKKPVTTRSRGSSSGGRRRLTDKQKQTLKRVAIGAGIAAATGAAIYGGYKLNKTAISRLQFYENARSQRHANTAYKLHQQYMKGGKVDAELLKRKNKHMQMARNAKAHAKRGKYSVKDKARALLNVGTL